MKKTIIMILIYISLCLFWYITRSEISTYLLQIFMSYLALKVFLPTYNAILFIPCIVIICMAIKGIINILF